LWHAGANAATELDHQAAKMERACAVLFAMQKLLHRDAGRPSPDTYE